VLIMGVGVAGLQAIATAKRLGAVIEASDVRPPVKEQVESLGAKFIDVPFLTDEEKEIAQGVGGYARPMPADWRASGRWCMSAPSWPTSSSPPR
jgi:NAD(P) transhydrogenase subunit alpha